MTTAKNDVFIALLLENFYFVGVEGINFWREENKNLVWRIYWG